MTVIAPVVATPPAFLTVIVYVAPVWPCEKLPVCVFAIVRSGPAPIVVGSVAVLLPVLTSPPPATVAVLVRVAGALDATLTVSVSAGASAPAAIGPLCVHERGATVQVQPAPLNAVGVRPPGRLSVTVIAPVVATPPAFFTVIVYVAPVWPCEKLPVCVFAIVRSGPAPIVVGSVAVLLPVLTSPPPATVAVLVRVAAASGATLTVSVSAARRRRRRSRRCACMTGPATGCMSSLPPPQTPSPSDRSATHP